MSSLRKWQQEDDGATAIEFAMIVGPFIFLIIGIVELSLFFASTSILHGATEDAARLIRTGQVQQTAGDPQQLFEDALCDHASVFISCDNIDYEVITLDGFSDFENHPVQYDEENNFESAGFSAGGVNDVVLIRAIHTYNFATPFIGHLLGKDGSTERNILSTIVLQTEPYDFDDGAGA